MELDSWRAALESDQKLALQTGGPVHNVATMPGFRFQPTEEELVGFYLREMAMGNRLEVDLINVLNLYRYDPWELPAMSFMQSEREWLFFCPRDKKYPNGARPNRVTASGYWKATGTDRPVRRAHDARCIGLKKTLVFYTGKAPRGRKTEWIMNEYRLPQNEPSSTLCQTLRSVEAKKINNLDLREVALCRIYKKPFQINLISATANFFADHLLPDIVDPLGSTGTAFEASPSPKLAGSIFETEIVAARVTASTRGSASNTNIVEDLKDLSSSFMCSKYPGIPAPARVDLSAQVMKRDGFRNSGSLFTAPSTEDRALKQHDRNAGAEQSTQQTVNRLNWSDCFPEVSVSPQHSSSSLFPTMASTDRLLKASPCSPLQPLSLHYPGALMKLDCGYNISELDKIGYRSAAAPQNINSDFGWNSLPL